MGESTAKILGGRASVPPRSIDSRTADGASYASRTEGRTRTRAPGEERTGGGGQEERKDRRGLAAWLRAPRSPRLWFEILLIAFSYWIYSLVRNAVPEQKAAAMRHASAVWRFEQSLGLAVERTVNHAMDSVTWLIVAMNYYYATLHFIVTIGVLVWLFRKHPGRYAPTRLVLFVTTGIALLGYYWYPLAPPRLMAGGGFLDTVKIHHTWGSMASGDLAHVSNQYAAMPSMHIGWSLWCGITIVTLARHRWVKALGVVYPAVTLLVIVSTANHFWMDAVGGMLCLTMGFGVSYAVYGRLAYRLPQRARMAAAPA
jgi:hypothetical protein